MSDELLPCPCCGEPVEHTSTPELERVDCMCGVTMVGITWPVLLVKWNQRVRKKESQDDRRSRMHLVGIIDRFLAQPEPIVIRHATLTAVRKYLSR